LAQLLIISDEPHTRKVVRENVERHGHQCDSVQSDTNIHRFLAQKEYDLIFCDAHLKEKSGFTLIRFILEQHSNMTAIMVADQNYSNIAEKIMNSGAYDFIQMPIDPERVKISLNNALYYQKIKNKNRTYQTQVESLVLEQTETTDKYEKKLNHLLEKLKFLQNQITQVEKMASIGQLAAGVAHEINNPIGFLASNLNTLHHYQKCVMALMIQNYKLLSDITDKNFTLKQESLVGKRVAKIKRLQARFDLDYLVQDTRALIKESIAGILRVKNIVRDLKAFVHPGQEDPELLNIHKHLDATLNLVGHQFKYGIKVQKEYGDLPLIKCWADQLNQVFLNMIVNAIQAMGKKGIISIKTLSCDDNHIEIRISDTGQGISEKNLTKVFDPFFTTKPVGKGTGIGLHMSYNIIKKHKGTIAVKSKLGYGSTFIIRIPVELKVTHENNISK
jgi:signal transduction histidine kinase